MYLNELDRKQLQHIISGTCIVESTSALHATRNYLCTSFTTNTKIKKDFEHQQSIKEKQERELILFAEAQNLLKINFENKEHYLTEGGEAKIYLSKDGTHVLKINDAI